MLRSARTPVLLTLLLYLFGKHIMVDLVVRANVRKCQAVPRLISQLA